MASSEFDASSSAAESGGAPATSALTQAQRLAVDVLCDVRASLMASLRFMDVALWRMPFSAEADIVCAVATDGYRLYYNPIEVMRSYADNPNGLVRSYLHCILHCVFRHQFDDRHPRRRLWDIACDVAVEAIALELVGMRYPDKLDDERARAIERLGKMCAQITAQGLYRLAAKNASSPDTQVSTVFAAGLEFETLAALFSRDDHGVWTRRPQDEGFNLRFSKNAKLIATDDGQHLKGKPEENDDTDEPSKRSGVNSPGAPAPSTGGAAAEGEVDNPDRLVDLDSIEEAEASFESMDGVEWSDFSGISWKDISKQMQMDMEAFVGKIGSTSGTFLVNLSVANRKTYDYRDFLKRFASRTEELKVSTEEFDYVYYTYGLRLYKNMPLVEPLEYQESNRIRDFVIAIDTSASCGGALVKKFVEKTYDVLKSESGFGRKINVHVIQCDCDIRKDIVITSTSDIDDSFMDFEIRGFGGTDFRPVFAYVDELVARRELLNLKGLIYLTDGLGKFPERPPDYDTAFVFVDDGQRERKVPPWAMKVIMDEDDIVEL